MFTNILHRFAIVFLIILSLFLLSPVSLSAQDKGKEGSKAGSDISAIAERVINMLDESEKSGGGFSERDGEELGGLIRSLSDSGDMRAKEALLKAMVTPYIGGRIILEGLYNLGPQVIPDIIEAIDNTENIIGKAGAIGALKYIYEKDTNKTYFSEKDKKDIKEKLVPYLSHDNEILRQKAEQAISTINNESKEEETSGGLMIGVADSNSIILPFAVYDSERWTAPWPEEDYDVYKTMEDIPKTWYSPLEKIPEKWNITYQDGKTGTIEISKPALVSSWCSQRWVLVGEATRKVHRGNKGDIYDISNSEGLFLATTGNQAGPGMRAPDKQSDEYSEIYKLIDASISASEHSGNHPVPESDRAAVKTELTTIVRNETPQDGCIIYYVEARKDYPDNSKKPWPEGLTIFKAVSYLKGWVLKDSNKRLSFIQQDFQILNDWIMYTPSDEPLGILKLDGRSFWVIRDWTSYESERWVIFDVSPSGIKQVLEVSGGGC